MKSNRFLSCCAQARRCRRTDCTIFGHDQFCTICGWCNELSRKHGQLTISLSLPTIFGYCCIQDHTHDCCGQACHSTCGDLKKSTKQYADSRSAASSSERVPPFEHFSTAFSSSTSSSGLFSGPCAFAITARTVHPEEEERKTKKGASHQRRRCPLERRSARSERLI